MSSTLTGRAQLGRRVLGFPRRADGVVLAGHENDRGLRVPPARGITMVYWREKAEVQHERRSKRPAEERHRPVEIAAEVSRDRPSQLKFALGVTGALLDACSRVHVGAVGRSEYQEPLMGQRDVAPACRSQQE
jgi:hypothetical protein